jgi:signal transduction histidine kinase
MFKEVLHNITKHSEATQVTVQFTCDTTRLQVSISDNGKGFDTNQHFSGHGLNNLRQRALQINATAQIHSRKDHGTQVVIIIPLEPIPRWWNIFSK